MVNTFFRVKANNVNMKVDLFVNGDLLEPADDKKLVSQLPLRDKMVRLFCWTHSVWIFMLKY